MLPCYMHYIKKTGGDGLVLHDREGKKTQFSLKDLLKKSHNGLFILSIREP